MKLSGWGRYPVLEARLRAPRSEATLRDVVAEGQAIARGNGRSYGDCAVSPSNTIHMVHFNRMLAFDDDGGVLVTEAGVLLSDIINTFLPRGWFPCVTPGTKFVTVGGLIAADVHGKNHHKDGSFGNCVEWLDLMDANGTVFRCSRTQNTELFSWTVGGMGLTGIILRAAMRLRKVDTAWIRQTTIASRDLRHTIDVIEERKQASYAVAWMDCMQTGGRLGRSIITLGEHASREEIDTEHRGQPLVAPPRKMVRIPIPSSDWVLNSQTVTAFNAFYYARGSAGAGVAVIDWERFFYPLDALAGWNKMYGPRGLVQFQCVLPIQNSRSGLFTLLNAISDNQSGPFLTVLKRLGPSSGGISFPMEGYTLAADFPVNRRTVSLLPTLESITIEHGGRFYLAKDACLTSDRLFAADERVSDFRIFRERIGSSRMFCSAQSQRLAI